MEKKLEVTLSSEDVRNAIKEYVATHYGLTVKSISMRTGLRGDYDKGNAREYVQSVSCKCE